MCGTVEKVGPVYFILISQHRSQTVHTKERRLQDGRLDNLAPHNRQPPPAAAPALRPQTKPAQATNRIRRGRAGCRARSTVHAGYWETREHALSSGPVLGYFRAIFANWRRIESS